MDKKLIAINSDVSISGFEGKKFRVIGRPFDQERNIQKYECIEMSKETEVIKVSAPETMVTVIKEYVKPIDNTSDSVDDLYAEDELSAEEINEINEGLEDSDLDSLYE